MADFRGELWVILSLYFAVLLGVLAFTALQRLRREKSPEGVMVEHYLAGRNISPVVLGFSLFASQFSGYTCVGLPAEAYKHGFFAWRWIGSTTRAIFVYMAYAPRLQWLGRERGYDSVLSFVRDRYGISEQRSDPMHWFFVLVLLVPCFIYLCAQFDAFGNTISSISGGAISPVAGALILGVVVTVYEILGGLRAVALTDVIQGATLVTGAMLILALMGINFGGLSQITAKLEEKAPKMVQVPDGSQDFAWAEFWIGVGVQRALFPDYPQRALAASSQHSLRVATAILAAAPFLVQVPMLFYGVVGAVHHPELDNPKKAFSLVALDIVNSGGGGTVVGSLMMSAVVAAIMSTADSVLIVVSQIVTLDVIRPLQSADGPGEAGPSSRLILASRIVTLSAAAVCIAIVPFDVNLSFMMQFQSAILMQTAPTLVLALYWKGMHRWSSMSGLVVGICLGIGLVGNKVPGGILISFAANVVVTLAVALFMPGAAEPANNRHKALLELVTWRPPAGRSGRVADLEREPIAHNWWAFLLAFALLWLAIPFYREPGTIDPYLSGSPLWAVVAILVMLAVHLLLVGVITFNWRGSQGKASAEPEAETVASKAEGPEATAAEPEAQTVGSRAEEPEATAISC